MAAPEVKNLVKGESGVSVGLEDLEDGVDVGGRAKVEPEVVRDGRVHDGPGRSLHGVVKTGVDNVLLGSTRHASVEFGRRGHRNVAADAAEPSLERVLSLTHAFLSLSLTPGQKESYLIFGRKQPTFFT